jgi:hypothetical protein
MAYTNKEAYYARINQLADTKKIRVEQTTRNMGTLIDYKRSGDGVSYGIIKENHNYYIKRGGLKQDPDSSDFTYIGGLENKSKYQYKSLSEADKNRNMLLISINEAVSNKFSKNRINEDKIGDDIENAESKLDTLDTATNAEATAGDEVTAGFESEPMGGDDMGVEPMGGEETPATDDMGGEETPATDDMDGEIPADMGGEETSDDDMGGEETTADDMDANDPLKDIEKSIGKLTGKIRKMELEPAQVKSFVNSYLSAFKDKFADVEIEDRKEMANRILKTVPPEDVASLGDTVEKHEVDENDCEECGSFGRYAESMGYDSPQSLMEADEDEVTNVIGGYATANAEGNNDGDFETVGLLLKLFNPDIIDKLKNDYGHEEYANNLQPHVDQMNEASDEESMEKLNELWGGLKSLGQGIANKAKEVGQGVADKAKQAGQGVADKAKEFGQGVQDKYNDVKQGVQQAATDIKQTYHGGEVNNEIKKLEQAATNLGQQVNALNQRLTKAGKQPINTSSIISTLSNQLRSKGGAVDFKNSKVGSAIEEIVDPAGIEVQPNLSNGFDNMGGGVVKPDGTPTTITIEGVNGSKVDIGLNEAVKQIKTAIIDAKNKKVKKNDNVVVDDKKSIKVKEPISESETKLRKYIRNRLEEISGKKKMSLNENKKSEKLKSLDKMIDESYFKHKK